MSVRAPWLAHCGLHNHSSSYHVDSDSLYGIHCANCIYLSVALLQAIPSGDWFCHECKQIRDSRRQATQEADAKVKALQAMFVQAQVAFGPAHLRAQANAPLPTLQKQKLEWDQNAPFPDERAAPVVEERDGQESLVALNWPGGTCKRRRTEGGAVPQGAAVQGGPVVSRHKGVSFIKLSRRWLVRIRVDGKQRYVGTFADEEEAAAAYQAAAMAIYARQKRC